MAWIDGGKSQTPLAGWYPADHLLLINEYVMAALAGEIRRLAIFTPPRHGKSEKVSRYTPAWKLGTKPKSQVILASYGAHLAQGHSRAARQILREWGPEVFGVDVDPTSSAVDRWQTTEGGVMVAAGIGGPVTGRGADLLVIDDPVKDMQEALSEVIRKRNIEWYQSVAATRLHPGAAAIVIQTRWHEGDLSGWLLTEHADDWTVLNLPAIAEELCWRCLLNTRNPDCPECDPHPDNPQQGWMPDPLGREKGEALWPGRYPKDALEPLAREVGKYVWAALYQQRPMPADGGIFKRTDFRYFDIDPGTGYYVLERPIDEGGREKVDPAYCKHFGTVDVAASEKETADYTVLSQWAVTPKRDLLLLDVVRVHFDTPNVTELLDTAYRTRRARMGWLDVEENTYGKGPVAELKKRGLPVRPITVDTDKVTRALAAVPRYEQHAVFHRAGGEYVGDYEAELTAFPNGVHDDQVDTFSMAAAELPRITFARPAKTPEVKTVTGGLQAADL